MSNEVVETFLTYGAAAQAACRFAQLPKDAVLEHYICRMPKNRAVGEIIGVGIKPKAHVLDIVRLDFDPDGVKGIHFNAARPRTDGSGKEDKYAAVIVPTTKDHKPADEHDFDFIARMQEQYLQYVFDLKRGEDDSYNPADGSILARGGLSAAEIWQTWSTGNVPVEQAKLAGWPQKKF